MDPLTAPLTPEEFDALREVSKGAVQRVIPTNLRDSLIAKHMIRQLLGGLGLTDEGMMRVEMRK